MEKVNFGLDAPKVVKSLFIFAAIVLIILFCSFFIASSFAFWFVVLWSLLVFLSSSLMGLWMLYGIKISKPNWIKKISRDLHLQGEEKVLDLGCGRGILLCEIAKYLNQQTAYGVDFWSTKDQSKNALEETLKNVKLLNLENKVKVQTADIRSLPYPKESFDVVVSSLCLHNLKEKKEREKALMELLRVLKPGGKFVLLDIFYVKDYVSFLSPFSEKVQLSPTIYSYCPFLKLVRGVKKQSKDSFKEVI